VTAAADQVVLAALVPPSMLRVMLEAPFVSKLTRMFSIDCAVSAQICQAKANALATSVPVVSNMLAGKSARLLQLYQARKKLVDEEVLSSGKLVRLLQPCQAAPKFVPKEVLIDGKLVRMLRPNQALKKFVTPLVTSNGQTNEVMLLAPYQAFVRFVPKLAPGPIVTDVI